MNRQDAFDEGQEDARHRINMIIKHGVGFVSPTNDDAIPTAGKLDRAYRYGFNNTMQAWFWSPLTVFQAMNPTIRIQQLGDPQ